ncbi:MAG: hypothetical protein LAT56_14350 [Wenzhouxiangella sp.]|nr:hypothetical protein [Wenzhouxiangella sp.]
MLKNSISLAIVLMSIIFPVKSESITATALWPEQYPQAGVGWYRDITPVYDIQGESVNVF